MCDPFNDRDFYDDDLYDEYDEYDDEYDEYDDYLYEEDDYLDSDLYNDLYGPDD